MMPVNEDMVIVAYFEKKIEEGRKCTLNCDTNKDGICDLNCDTNGAAQTTVTITTSCGQTKTINTYPIIN